MNSKKKVRKFVLLEKSTPRKKRKFMLTASRQKRNTLIDGNLKLAYNNLELQISSNEKILGVHVDENLFWNNHLQQVSKKIS